MSDPLEQFLDGGPTVLGVLFAVQVVDRLVQDLAIQYQAEGDTFDRETMQKHCNDRGALIRAKEILIDEAERLNNLTET